MDRVFFSFVYTPMQLGLFNFGLQNGFLINQSLLIPQKRLLSSYLIKIKNDLEFLKLNSFQYLDL